MKPDIPNNIAPVNKSALRENKMIAILLIRTPMKTILDRPLRVPLWANHIDEIIAPIPIEDVSIAKPCGPELNTVSLKPGSNSIIGLANIEFTPVIKTIMKTELLLVMKVIPLYKSLI